MENNFIRLNAFKISQNEDQHRGMFVSKLRFMDLKLIFRLTERKESNIDPFDIKGDNYSRQSISNLFKNEEEEEFQRHLNPAKLKEIKNFLISELTKDTDNPLFPTSMILSLQLSDDNDFTLTETEIFKNYSNSDTTFIIPEGDNYKILIPKIERTCLIVDGQHRFWGIKKFYDQLSEPTLIHKIENFEFITTLLLGYDTFEIAQVFANVNFTQKPVNKSLYYDIFGSPASEKSDIQLAHYLALHLNNSESSPLKGMIKLLGRGEGFFSQAFFVEKTLIHFRKGGSWEKIYNDYINDRDSFKVLPTFLSIYFDAIKENFWVAWPQHNKARNNEFVYSSRDYDYILCKTTGMGAFMRLIKDFFPRVSDMNDREMFNYFSSIFSRLSKEDIRKFFHKEGEFGKGGSEGFQIRLYKELRTKLFGLVEVS